MSSYYGDSARSAPSWDALDSGYDDDVIDLSEYQYAARDHILFAIDASESMHTPLPDEENSAGLIRGKSPFHQALEAVVRIERTKIVTGPSDSVGVLLYNVDSDSAPPSTAASYQPGAYVVQALRQISAEEIKRLIQILQTADQQYAEQGDGDEPTVEPPILRESFPPRSPKLELNPADVLTTCKFVFRDGGNKMTGNSRIFLVTDNDEPPGSATNRAPARTVYGDLAAQGIVVNTYFVNRPDHAFDAKLYWNDVLGRYDDATDLTPQDGLEQLSDIICDLVIRQAPKRKQFSIPLKFGGRDGDIEIGVAGYALISVQTKGQPKLVRMRGQAVEEVQIKTEYTSAETGAELPDTELTTAFQFGKESAIQNILEPNWWESDDHLEEQQAYAEELLRLQQERDENRKVEQNGVEPSPTQEEVPQMLSNGQPRLVAKTRLQFSDDEIKSFKTMGIEPPQIKILGFQSPDKLRLEDNIKHSYFIYPDETTYTGSTRTFTALLKSCLKLNRHALALSRLRASSQPEFCVLIPQAETFSKEGGQEEPPGFHVIILPFVDDLRDPPKNITDNIPANDEQIKIMEKMMRRLRFKSGRYASDAYPNPALDYHQKQLQALAFDEDFDTEMFDDKALPKYAGIHRAAGPLMVEWKRLIDEDDRAVERLAPATKRNVVEVDESDLVDVVGAYKKGNIEKLKVQELKDYAKYHKISITGRTKKIDIIDALTDHLDKEVNAKKSKK